MKNIIDSQVTKRTSEMLYQLDQFKRFTEEFYKDEYVRSVKLKQHIHTEYKDQLNESKLQNQLMQQKHIDFKIGLNTEVEAYLNMLKNQNLKHIKELMTNAIGDTTLCTTAPDKSTVEPSKFDKNQLKSIQNLYNMFKQMRVFYVLKANQLKEKFK